MFPIQLVDITRSLSLQPTGILVSFDVDFLFTNGSSQMSVPWLRYLDDTFDVWPHRPDSTHIPAVPQPATPKHQVHHGARTVRKDTLYGRTHHH